MKKISIIITLIICLPISILFGQHPDLKSGVILNEYKDDMTEKVHITPSRNIIFTDDYGGKTLILNMAFFENTEPILYTNMKNIGGCNEKDELIILFENDIKIKLYSYNSFNCDGVGGFYLSRKNLDFLRKYKILKVRIENGYSHDSFTSDVALNDQCFFNNILYLYDNKIFKKLSK